MKNMGLLLFNTPFFVLFLACCVGVAVEQGRQAIKREEGLYIALNEVLPSIQDRESCLQMMTDAFESVYQSNAYQRRVGELYFMIRYEASYQGKKPGVDFGCLD